MNQMFTNRLNLIKYVIQGVPFVHKIGALYSFMCWGERRTWE